MNRKYARLAVAGVAAMVFSVAGWAADAPDSTSQKQTQAESQEPTINMFGGPAYLGEPDLELTAAFLKAGGGAENFSTAKALTAMLGEDTVKAEVAKLQKQYGEEEVNNWLKGTDGVVANALKHASEQGVSLPEAPADLSGQDLAKALVAAGTAQDGTFWSGRLYDKLVSHDIHNAVMADVNQDPDLGIGYDKNVHKITNQAFHDAAQALGADDVKLADLH